MCGYVLLVEPKYYTRFPPLGLLKIASYHRARGDEVRLVRGARAVGHEPDRVYVTSLYTWTWRAAWEAVRYYKARFPGAEVWLGGIYASLLPDHAAGSGADVVWRGIFPEAEDLTPAYDLVPGWRATVLFASRGCIRRCPFCAVPRIEGPLGRVKYSVRDLVYPGHRKVVFFDNNILASPGWRGIFEELVELGLKVDFNQGLDARLLGDEAAELLSRMRVDPVVRLAYDDRGMGRAVGRAVRALEDHGVRGRRIMVYILYNFRDGPEDFLERVRDVLEWGAVAYPMRYEPLDALEKNGYVSPGWTREELEAVQAARRVLGYGGAFPPYAALVEKVGRARDFAEAFSLRPARPDSLTTAPAAPPGGA